MRSLSIASTGMLAQQLNVEVISNNIANMNTTGFKRQRAEFQDLLYQNIERMGVSSSDAGTIIPTGIQVGTGVKTASVYRIMQQGDMNQTENPFDLAIEGRGFFRIRMPSGETAYTRAGSFSTNAEGQIVTPDGYAVEPGITIPDRRDQGDDQHRRPSLRAPGRSSDRHAGRSVRSGDLRQRSGTRFARLEPLPRNRRLGLGPDRHARIDGLRRDRARLARNLQRQRRHRDHLADFGPARLRNEFQSRQRIRRNVADDRAFDA